MKAAPDLFAWEDSDRALRWQAEQDDLARRHIASIPGVERLRELVADASRRGSAVAPLLFGNRWFRAPRPTAGTATIETAPGPDGPWDTLVDVASLGDVNPALDWWYPSPDGSRVAVGVCTHGSEQSVLHIVEADTGEVLPDRIPNTSYAVVAWLPGSDAFFYNRSRRSDWEDPRKDIYFHRVGDEPARTPEPAPARGDEDMVLPQTSADGKWVACVSSEVAPCVDSIRRVDDGPSGWRPFLLDVAGTFFGFFKGDAYVCVTTNEAPRGRIVEIPLETPFDERTWREIVPESDAVLRQVSPLGDRLVVVSLVETAVRVQLVEATGAHVADLGPDSPAVASLAATRSHMAVNPLVATDGNDVIFVRSSFDQPPSVIRTDGEALDSEARAEGAGSVVAELRRAPSSDGYQVSYWLVRSRDMVERGAETAALIFGYGGWNIAMGLPGYLDEFTPFVDAGGALVFPHLRGGSEHGDTQWQDGRLAVKQHTFDDAYAVAEALIADGVAAPGRLGIAGASNGGLLAAAAAVQRPDLFRAVVPLVPLTDMLRYERDPFVAEYAIEYGSASDPRCEEVLNAYSPLHNICDGVEYPATLVICGDHDVRCPAWHGRTFVARLQATGSKRPALLRVARDAGHASASAVTSHEWLAFLMSELGLEIARSSAQAPGRP
ncbi:MAG: prolyl oligopeptidase [Gaiellales bacterium]|jgi:prolyl oligopeptidase|nr:prolyl oligopeptidase [Gaiellales bacterium]